MDPVTIAQAVKTQRGVVTLDHIEALTVVTNQFKEQRRDHIDRDQINQVINELLRL